MKAMHQLVQLIASTLLTILILNSLKEFLS